MDWKFIPPPAPPAPPAPTDPTAPTAPTAPPPPEAWAVTESSPVQRILEKASCNTLTLGANYTIAFLAVAVNALERFKRRGIQQGYTTCSCCASNFSLPACCSVWSTLAQITCTGRRMCFLVSRSCLFAGCFGADYAGADFTSALFFGRVFAEARHAFAYGTGALFPMWTSSFTRNSFTSWSFMTPNNIFLTVENIRIRSDVSVLLVKGQLK